MNTVNQYLIPRWEVLKKSVDSHPYAQWVAVLDPRCSAPCRDLKGKVWRVDGKALSDLIRIHVAQQNPECRCRLRPMSLAAIANEHIQTMD